MTIVIRVNAYQNDIFVIQKYSLNDGNDTPLLLSVTTGNIDALNGILEREPDKIRGKVLKDLSISNESIVAYTI